MGKKLFVENVSAPLTYKEPTEGSNALGRLEGVGGSWKDPTRNDRLYNRRLWENIKSSESFQEGMETRTIFAEANHPEERIDIDIKEVAGVLTDLEILDSGDIFTGFDILPTPNGKIIKTLVDYGCKIGVSSRGLGDEIVENGVTMIDPDSYEYYCHDFVVTPAVKKARPQLIEEKENKSFIDRVKHIVSEVKSKDELQSIKRLIESTEIPTKSVLVESIDNKISSLSESADNQSNAGDEKTAELESKITTLESDNVAKTAQLEKVKGQLKHRGSNARYFRRALQEQSGEIKDLEAALEESLESITGLSRELRESRSISDTKLAEKDNEISKLKSTLKETRKVARRADLLETKVSNMQKAKMETLTNTTQLKAKVNELEETLSTRDIYIEKLEAKLKETKASLESAKNESKVLTESRQSKITSLNESVNTLKEEKLNVETKNRQLEAKVEKSSKELKTLQESNQKIMEEYIKRSCAAANLKYENVISMITKPYTIESINNKINELADRQRRFDMLPLSMPTMSGRVVEHHGAPSRVDDTPSFVVESLKRG